MIPTDNQRRLLVAMRRIGPLSLARSAYLSYRQTGRVDGLVVGKNAICDIASGGNIDVRSDARLLFATGDKEFAATHSDLGRSKLKVANTGTLTVTAGNARIGSCSVLHVEGDFSIGASYINSHTRIVCGDEITIGDGCAIAWNVELLDDDRHQLESNGQPMTKTAPITIRDNVWVGNNVLIKKGVTVGSGAVIASGSVVTNDVPSGTLVGGHPAEVLRQDVDWQ